MSETIIKSNKDEIPQPPNLKDDELADQEALEVEDDEAAARAKIEALMQLPKEQREARLASILDRGVLHDRLKVDLPDNLYGEWVRKDPLSVDAMRAIGFWVDSKYATKRSIHSDGSAANIVGDTVYMVTLRENKEMIEAARMEKSNRNMGVKKSAEEKEFESETARDTGGVIPTFSESTTRPIKKADVEAAMQQAEAQTK